MSNGPNGDRWSRDFNKANKSITHRPKSSFQSSIEVAQHRMNDVKNTAKNTVSNLKDIKDAKGINGKLRTIGKKLANTDKAKQLKKNITKAIDSAKLFIANAQPIAIISAIVLLVSNATIFIISVVQSVNPTPHYYCDINANASIKKTAVYIQYCAQAGSFELENLNGHYIVQDGSGPCCACAMNNMFMRYYTLAGVNYFDYLWGEDGKYKPTGQTITASTLVTPASIRKIVNGGSTAINDITEFKCLQYRENGTYEFAQKHGMLMTMANWGYLRDSSLDIADYEQTDDYYIDNSDSDKWVWDLSVPNQSPGSYWGVLWDYTITIDNIPCITSSYYDDNITGQTIKDILDGKNGEVGEAGVVLYYSYPKANGVTGYHAILVTGYDVETNTWRVIDSAKGMSGGYEGPLDGSNHFAIFDTAINDLLSSGANSCPTKFGTFKIESITYCSLALF